MRNDFLEEMLDPSTEKIEDFLGNFAKIRSRFTLLSGHKRLIKELIKVCQKLYEETPLPEDITTQGKNRTHIKHKKLYVSIIPFL